MITNQKLKVQTFSFLPALKSILLAILSLISFNLLVFSVTRAQPATISEETRVLKTYPYSNPDPVAILGNNPKIYPYHQFLGYSQEPVDQDWKVVVMENDYLQVFVLPESGGKVWGAIEKSTGEEFIYRNEVMKFRNIAMRGPWTSGGIEFNFGIIGHAPSTASPVDYHVEEHDDGSVSCTVGAMDLTSRTQWRVKIILPADKAYFKTESTWYNPTPQHQAYYNWMTAAARASDDLEFFYPGNAYLGHPGDLHSWPIDARGRDLSFYRNNNFGGSKSYHVVGNYHNFFGGYWHDRHMGFGHWSRYDDMPGQKLWIWALSRAGAIWEDLLTDTDGQYIEFQAGRLLTQYSYSSERNPITEVAFGPYVTDQWEELWFPIKELGGVSSVSPQGAVYVTEEAGKINMSFNAFGEINDTLTVLSDEGKVIHQEAVIMEPMEVISVSFDQPQAERSYRVCLQKLGHIYKSTDSLDFQLHRPFSDSSQLEMTKSQQLFYDGYQLFKNRNFEQAKLKLRQALELSPAYQAARIRLAELLYRNAQYEAALDQIYLALQLDAYHAGANYIAAIIFKALEKPVDALEAFGWAARSMEYRSAAYTQMAEIQLQSINYEEAEYYSRRALDFNQFNIPAWQNLAVIYRKTRQKDQATSVRNKLLTLDPLNHFARFEAYLVDSTQESRQKFESKITNEFPVQSYLEIAMKYYQLRQTDDAVAVLALAPNNALVKIWQAYLTQDNTDTSLTYLEQALALPPQFVFPYRPETLEALDWALTQRDHWKLHYYIGLNLWGLNQLDEATSHFRAANDQPDYAPFYLSRAELLKETSDVNPQSDIERAFALGKDQWTVWHQYLQFLNRHSDSQQALLIAQEANQKFSDNYVIGMDYALALFNAEEYSQCISVLNNLQILPYEGASEGRVIYEQAHLYLALKELKQENYNDAITTLNNSLEWPENLGVGKPYNPDITLQNFMLANSYERSGKNRLAKQHYQKIINNYSLDEDSISPRMLLVLASLKKLNQEVELKDYLQKLDSVNSNTAQWITAIWQGDQSVPDIAESRSSDQYQLVKEIYQTLLD